MQKNFCEEAALPEINHQWQMFGILVSTVSQFVVVQIKADDQFTICCFFYREGKMSI